MSKDVTESNYLIALRYARKEIWGDLTQLTQGIAAISS